MKKYFIVLLGLLTIYVHSSFAASICQHITTPGEYNFSSFTSFPTDPDDAAICIDVSDVTIDFEGGFLDQDSASTATGFTGIRVSPNLSNIVIKNVTIKFLTGIAIDVGSGCQNVRIENVIVNDCDETGILFAGTMSDIIEDGLICNCFIRACTGAQGGVAYGIRLVRCDNVHVINTTFNKNDAGTANSGFGLSLEHCSACKIINCNANDNGGNELGAGISIFDTEWTLIDGCKVVNTIGRANTNASKAVGVFLDQSSNIVVKDCIVKHSNNSLKNAYGFESSAGLNNTFSQCTTKNNEAGTFAAGFILDDTENKSSVVNCISRLNDGGVSGQGYGIYLDTAQNCNIWYNRLLNNTGSTAYGLRDTVTNTTNLIAGNVTFGNTTGGFNVIRTAGTFPVVEAQVGDFTPTTTVGCYYNVSFSTGPN